MLGPSMLTSSLIVFLFITWGSHGLDWGSHLINYRRQVPISRSSHRAAAVQRETENAISEVAERAARAAGREILDGSKVANVQVTSKQGSRDLVTEFDLRSQNVIKQTISCAFPGHKFLGEEDIDPGREAATEAIGRFCLEDNLWIVDPIDGTTNFAHGMPIAGVIIAYARKGVVEYGCIYDPFRDEYFSAWRGKGATMNGQMIHCCSAKLLKDSVVSTGSPPNISSLNACLRATNLISSEVRTVRMLGSAAIMLAWVACGKLTAYFEADLNVWDLAAGSLIIKEAGGHVTDVWGNPYELKTRNIVASSSGIHDALLERLQVARMWME